MKAPALAESWSFSSMFGCWVGGVVVTVTMVFLGVCLGEGDRDWMKSKGGEWEGNDDF